MSDRCFWRVMPVAALLFVLLSPGAWGQENPKLVAMARATATSEVAVLIDSSQGPQVDELAIPALRDRFNGAEWRFFDNSQLIISKDGQPLLVSLYFPDPAGRGFLLHFRDQTRSVSGKITRDAQKPEQADAFVVFAAPGEAAGTTRTVYVSVVLTFTQ